MIAAAPAINMEMLLAIDRKPGPAFLHARPVRPQVTNPMPQLQIQARSWLARGSLAFLIMSGVLNVDSFSPVMH